MRSTLRTGVGYHITKIIASTRPTDPSCVVVVCLFNGTYSFAFSFISDDSWTVIEGDERKGINFQEKAEIVDGKLYALTDETLNSIIICDLRKKPVKPQVLAKLPATTRASITLEFDPRFPHTVVYNAHDVVNKSLAFDSSSQELFLVYLFYNSKYSNGARHVSLPNFTGREVFKLDNITSSDEAEWVEVRNLKNRMLYVDSQRSCVVSNVGVHGPKELIEDNCIYFAYRFLLERIIISTEPTWEGMRIGRHCRSDGTMSYYEFEIPDLNDKSPPTWFIPHL